MLETIKQIPDYENMTAQQIHDYLSEQVITEDATPYNSSKLQDALEKVYGVQQSFEYTNIVLSSLREAGKTLPLLEGAYLAMNTGEGISLNTDLRQSLVDQISAEWPVGLADTVKKLGRPIKVRAEILGLASVPSVEEIQAALDADVTEPDSWDNEILLSVNKSQGSLNVFARVTPVGLKDGIVIKRGEAATHVNGDLLALVQPILDSLVG